MSRSAPSRYQNKAYEGKTPLGARPPWEIDGPQPALAALERSGVLSGHVLDAGCGTGEMARYLASRGLTVTGVDMSATAIELAQRRAVKGGAEPTFVVGDVLDLSEYPRTFDAVVDCGLFPRLERRTRPMYTASLFRACRPGARACLLEYSDEGLALVKARFAEAGVPVQVLDQFFAPSPTELRAAFAEGWDVRSIDETSMWVRFPGSASQEALPAWLTIAQRGA